MSVKNIPYQIIDWAKVPKTEHIEKAACHKYL